MKNALLILFIAGICMAFAGSVHAGNAAKAPTVATLDSLSNKYGPVIFDHAKHVAIAANCGTCHHQHSNFSTLPCKECHSLDAAAFRNSVVNNFMACRNCHGSYDRSNPKMPGLKTAYHQQCFQCHRGMGEVGVSPAGCTIMCHGKKGTIAQKG
jgi:Doubled CXXCH motif (Paired_CXXCH_1)